MQKKLKAGSADSQINDKLQGLALFIVVIFPPCTCSLSPWPKAAAHSLPSSLFLPSIASSCTHPGAVWRYRTTVTQQWCLQIYI